MSACPRIVIKIGSSTLVNEAGSVDGQFLDELGRQIARLKEQGKDSIIVSSGAIAAGLTSLGIGERPTDMPSLQAAASVGSVALAHAYDTYFSPHGLTVGQVLLTKKDTASRDSYLLACDTFERLIELGVVPIVNENDTVAVDEIKFGDNDTLAALVGSMVYAEKVILLSDIDGFYDIDPKKSDDAQLLDEVEELTCDLLDAAGCAGSQKGSGGMVTKLEAARVLMRAGIPMIICDGRRENVILDVIEGKNIGTTFKGTADPLNAKKLWIALGSQSNGTITIDAGALSALREHGKSLLCAGITAIEGSFIAGDTVLLRDEEGQIVGRGITQYSSDEIGACKGKRSDEVASMFPHLAHKVVVHRDQLAVL